MTIKLTKRQADVLAWIQRGASNKQIAQRLSIAESSVKAHIGALLKKYAAPNRQVLAMSSLAGQPVPPPMPANVDPFGWVHMHGDKVVGIMFTKNKPKDGWLPIYIKREKE
jgi:DNA-binding CsgD family transcriptional regulator